jgi:hypothetical protein
MRPPSTRDCSCEEVDHQPPSAWRPPAPTCHLTPAHVVGRATGRGLAFFGGAARAHTFGPLPPWPEHRGRKDDSPVGSAWAVRAAGSHPSVHVKWWKKRSDRVSRKTPRGTDHVIDSHIPTEAFCFGGDCRRYNSERKGSKARFHGCGFLQKPHAPVDGANFLTRRF